MCLKNWLRVESTFNMNLLYFLDLCGSLDYTDWEVYVSMLSLKTVKKQTHLHVYIVCQVLQGLSSLYLRNIK